MQRPPRLDRSADPSPPITLDAPPLAPLASALRDQAPLVPSSDDTLRSVRKPGFLSGVRAFLSAGLMLVSTPSWWGLALVPMIMALATTTLAAALAVMLVPHWVATTLGSSDVWWSIALQTVATIVVIVVGILSALALAQPLSGPALDALVRRVEKRLGSPARPETPFFTAVARSLASALLGLGFGVPLFALALLINLIPGGSFVAFPLKILVAMIVIAWDLCDYPLSVRGVPLGERIRFMSRHFSAVLGFGLGLALVALLPCGALLILPVGVVGATRLVHDIEEHEREARR